MSGFKTLAYNFLIDSTFHVLPAIVLILAVRGIYLICFYQKFLFALSVIARTYFIVLSCYQIKKFHDVENWVHYWLSLLEGKKATVK